MNYLGKIEQRLTPYSSEAAITDVKVTPAEKPAETAPVVETTPHVFNTETKQEPVQVKAPGTADPGSSKPENWQTNLQTGLSEHQLREAAKDLAKHLEGFQAIVPILLDHWKNLTINDGKHLELNLPIIMKNLSREKLLGLAEILTKLAEKAMIV